MLEMGDHKE